MKTKKQCEKMTTSILEELCKDYIDSHIIEKKDLVTGKMKKQYIGDMSYLVAYSQLVTYNKMEQKK